MRVLLKFAIGLLAASAIGAHGADLAVLRNGFSISHQRRDVIGSITRLYTSSDGKSFVDVATEQIDHFDRDFSPPPQIVLPATATAVKSPPTLDQVVSDVSDRHHLDPDFVNSVIRAESGFNPHAVSSKGAQGLMQLMPQTSQQLGVRNPFDPSANLEGGTRYLRELLERYNFDVKKALAAYNAGPHRVEQYRGVPPYYETRAYIARIVRDYNRKKLAERKMALASQADTKHKTPSQRSVVKQAAVRGTSSSALP
jgi:soluble lytic murein transglycosylase-like protein